VTAPATAPRPAKLATKRLDAFEATFQIAQLMFRRSLRGWRILASAAVVVIPAALAALVRSKAPGPDVQERFFYGTLASYHFAIAVPVVAMLFATAFPGPEAEEGTLSYWFTSPVPRWTVLLGRWCAALVLGSLLLPLAVLALVLPLQLPAGAEVAGIVRVAITSTLLAYAAYLSLFQLVAVGARRALSLCVVFVLVQLLISFFTGAMVKLTIVYYVRSILIPAIPKTSLVNAGQLLSIADPASVVQSVVTLACVAVLALGLSLLLVERIEYRGRTSQPG
jgi:ABC-type transport system involved in multi-copper enzyme maturation permease subunit